VGSGKFWYDDQHPFMFILLALMFIFTGPGAGALDSVVFKKK
jgi:putative oxidoreductase